MSSQALGDELARELLEVAFASKLDNRTISYALCVCLAAMIQQEATTHENKLGLIGVAVTSIVTMAEPYR